MTFEQRARELEWILLDVDGVLTDGRLHYGARGEELKVFHVRDGLALKLARKAGLKVGLLSGRRTEAVLRRANELDLDEVLLGQGDKDRAFESFLQDHGTQASKVAYIGDDLPDLAVLRLCGLSFAPRDAAAEVLEVVTRVLEREGGQGAAREMIECLLKARGEWERLVELAS